MVPRNHTSKDGDPHDREQRLEGSWIRCHYNNPVSNKERQTIQTSSAPQFRVAGVLRGVFGQRGGVRTTIHSVGGVIGQHFFFMDGERAQENLQRARLHGSYFTSDDHCATLPLEKMFEVGTVRKVQEHNDFRATHVGLDGTFILDAEQTPEFSSPGRVFFFNQNSC